MIKKILFPAVILLVLASCASDSESDLTESTPSNNEITYSNTIAAIVDQSCATTGCHDATTKQSGVDLSTYQLAKTGFAGRAWVRTNAGTMPPSSPLPTATIEKIKNWVDNDFKN